MNRRSRFDVRSSATLTGSPSVAKLLSATLVLVLLCQAPLLQARAGWTEYARVGELIATSKHYYEVRIPVRDNPSGCREDHWFYQNYDAPGSAQMFEILFDAVKSDLRVRIHVTGVCNINGYGEISSVGVAR